MKTLTSILPLAFAVAFGTAAHAQVDDPSDPGAMIRTATQRVLDEVRARAIEPGDIPRITHIANDDIVPHTDLRRTTQLAMGRYWRTATPEQQQQIVEQFRLLLIHTYSGALGQLRPDQQIEYPPLRMSPSDTDVVVRTIATRGGRPVEINYRLYRTPDGWRVYDVNVLGAWLIQTYREQFDEKIRQSGVDGLIRFLAERNAQLGADRR
jgi:phospholipid transport system substrate-binding protein